MLSLLKRLFQLLPGFLLIVVVVWLGGPYLVISGNQPLASESARLATIACIVLAWLGWLLFERWRARRASGKLAAAVISQAHAEPAPPADVVKLRESFEQAVATLGSRRKAGSLYDLPWYVFMGPPGSGKTTALLNSGLHFALEQGPGQARLRGVGGTRNCDWWFTDEAVFLDTAGRFTTQDSDAASDSAGWKEFLALLCKYRKRRPINGVILTVSVKDLLTQSDFVREQQVEAARYRLRELGRELQIELPVYVMVTMCDLVAGFTEYFDDLTQEGRAQVWGVTFPYAQSVDGQAARALPAEFEALVARLNERLFARLQDERDVPRRARIFAFPQQLASLRESLSQFVTEVFAATTYQHRILLRGVYFTSGTQEGTPIDRLLGAIGRGFQVAPAAVAAPEGRGKAYFVERLLKQVLIGESGLAGVNRRFEMQQRAAQFAVYAALVVVVVFGAMTLSMSYRRNAAYLSDMTREVERLDKLPAAASFTSVASLAPRLDAVRAVVDAANRHNAQVPIGMRWGLYQGHAVAAAARDRYLYELDALMPFLAQRLQRRIRKHSGDPEALYAYLKAYMMLSSPEHLDKQHLQLLASREWSADSGVSDEDGASLTRHFQTLLDGDEPLRPLPTDGALVTQACNTVRQASLERIMYGWLRDRYATDEHPGVRLDLEGGVAAAEVIRRKSGVSLSEPVPAIYSRQAFETITGDDLPQLVDEFAKDDWVCAHDRDLANRERLQRGLLTIYQQEYQEAWDAVLNDLAIVSPDTVGGVANLLGILGGPASPLRQLLVVITEHTRLMPPAKPAAEEQGVVAKGRSYLDRLATVLPKQGAAPVSVAPAATTPGAGITAHFQDIHNLLAGAPGNTPLDVTLNRLRDLEQQLMGLGPQVGGRKVSEALRDPQFRQLFGQLDRDAERLPNPVRDWVTHLGAGVQATVGEASREELVTAYRREVVSECERFVGGRYPFASGSSSEIPLTEFSRLFGPGGVFDRFFTERLQELVDTSTRPWSWRPGIAAPLPGMLAHFADARDLRDAFFAGGGPLPQLRFDVTITYVDQATTRFSVDIDGQRFEDRRAKTPGTWPGQNAGSASAAFEDRTSLRSGSAEYHGPWALFRLIDASSPRRENERRTTLTFRGRSGHEARVVIEATSLSNPFARREWQGFSCGS